MAIDSADKSIIEAWTGPILAGDEPDVDQLITDYGSAYVVALQRLLTQRAEMISTPARVTASGDTVDHSANLKHIGEQIERLVGAIRTNESITLSPAGEALVDSAAGATLNQTKSVPLRTDNRRRGG